MPPPPSKINQRFDKLGREMDQRDSTKSIDELGRLSEDILSRLPANVGQSMKTQANAIEDAQSAIKHLKEKQVEVDRLKRLGDESMKNVDKARTLVSESHEIDKRLAQARDFANPATLAAASLRNLSALFPDELPDEVLRLDCIRKQVDSAASQLQRDNQRRLTELGDESRNLQREVDKLQHELAKTKDELSNSNRAIETMRHKHEAEMARIRQSLESDVSFKENK